MATELIAEVNAHMWPGGKARYIMLHKQYLSPDLAAGRLPASPARHIAMAGARRSPRVAQLGHSRVTHNAAMWPGTSVTEWCHKDERYDAWRLPLINKMRNTRSTPLLWLILPLSPRRRVSDYGSRPLMGFSVSSFHLIFLYSFFPKKYSSYNLSKSMQTIALDVYIC